MIMYLFHYLQLHQHRQERSFVKHRTHLLTNRITLDWLPHLRKVSTIRLLFSIETTTQHIFICIIITNISLKQFKNIMYIRSSLVIDQYYFSFSQQKQTI